MLQTNQAEITNYLTALLCATTEMRASLEDLRKGIRQLEETLTVSDQINEEEMQRCAIGLLRSDLLNHQKKAALADISSHKETASIVPLTRSFFSNATFPAHTPLQKYESFQNTSRSSICCVCYWLSRLRSSEQGGLSGFLDSRCLRERRLLVGVEKRKRIAGM